MPESELMSAGTGVLSQSRAITLSVLDTLQTPQLTVSAFVLPKHPSFTEQWVLLDWDSGATSIIKYNAGDVLVAAQAALDGIARGAGTMGIEAVLPGRWGTVRLDIPDEGIAGGVSGYFFVLTRAGDASLWTRGESLVERHRIQVPSCREHLDCVSTLAVVIDGFLQDRPSFRERLRLDSQSG